MAKATRAFTTNAPLALPAPKKLLALPAPKPLLALPAPKPTPERFGLIVAGSCLSPRVENGQVVVVEPGLPAPGDLAVVWLKGQSIPMIKVLRTAIFGFPHNPKSEVICSINLEQLNPPDRFAVWADKVERVARVHSVLPATRG